MIGETDVNIEAEIAKLIALRQPARKPLSEHGSMGRYGKLARKQAQREGLIAGPAKKELDAGKPAGRRQLPTHR
jgi:hypothetical protein